jgi:hypothetical protein
MRRKRMSGYRKYGNKKVTTADGCQFDSIKESQRWCELRMLEKAGMITELRRQEKFVLIPTQYKTYERLGKNGQPIKPLRKLLEHECSYIADFVYKQAGETVVEDTKGFRTADYRIKKKLMLWVHGIRIKET